MSEKNEDEARKTAVSQVSRITFATEEIINDENWLLGFTKVETNIPKETKSQKENAQENFQLESKSEEGLHEWIPLTTLGLMVKHKYYKSIKEIRQNNLTICEPSIVDYMLGPTLSSEVLYTKPIYDQSNEVRGYISCACAGDKNGHFGYSIKYDPNPEISIQESIDRAINVIDPIKRLSYKVSDKTFYTVPFPVTGVSAGVTVKLTPDCSSTEMPHSDMHVNCMLSLAGIDNCIVEIDGCHSFAGHLVLATYKALLRLCDYE